MGRYGAPPERYAAEFFGAGAIDLAAAVSCRGCGAVTRDADCPYCGRPRCESTSNVRPTSPPPPPPMPSPTEPMRRS